MAHPELQDTEIPVIDISNPSTEVAQQVFQAASTHGFLFIKNDGVTIPPKDIKNMFDLSRQFFEQPRAVKEEYAIHSEKAGGLNKGWVAMQGEALDPDGQKQGDCKEAFNISPPSSTTPEGHLQPLPRPLFSYADIITHFQASCNTLCLSILRLLAIGLKIPDTEEGQQWFAVRHNQAHGPSGTILRLLYYPATHNSNSGDARAGAHSDYGSITLLFRLPGQAGLEILKDDGSWVPVPVNPNPSVYSDPPILVNIGDLLSFWTHGLLKSTIHRVAFSDNSERYSLAYFCHPLDEVELEAIPSEVVEEGGSDEEMRRQMNRLGLGLGQDIHDRDGNKSLFTARQHLDRRLKVTYGL